MKSKRMTWMERRVITRHDNDPYLMRWTIFQCPWFGVMVHRFLSSDDECLHDHPWSFVSIILRGGYWEWTVPGGILSRRWYAPGSILVRRSRFAHRIEIIPDGWPTFSLVMTGPRVRPWGFFTRLGWLPWQKYRYSEHCS